MDTHKIVCWVVKEDREQAEIELEEIDLKSSSETTVLFFIVIFLFLAKRRHDEILVITNACSTRKSLSAHKNSKS